jgi:hypothetical protein
LQGIEKRRQEVQGADNESLRLFSPLLYQLSYPAINLVNNNLQTVNFAPSAILIPQSDTTLPKISLFHFP